MTTDAARLRGLYGAAQRRPLYSHMPSLYFGVPATLRRLVRRVVGLSRGRTDRLVQRYLDRLDDLSTADGRPVPLLLTHDVDTAEGYRRLGALLDVEEQVGLRSVSHLVTHRYPWSVPDLVPRAERGHAFGVHDTLHDNRIAYLPPDAIAQRLRDAQGALGALNCGTFRAPAFLRSEALYRAMEGLVTVDLSSPDWALLWPHPGDGIGTPFPIRHGSTVCVPTTMPRDGEMISIGLDGDAMVELWRHKASKLWRVGAPVVLLTHPDRGFTDSPARIAAYASLLRWFTESGRFDTAPPLESLTKLRQMEKARVLAR
jgi:hypothetical protein